MSHVLHTAVFLLAAQAQVVSAAPATGARAAGEVRDAVTRAPLAGVLVHVVGTADSVRTSPDGRWSLPGAAGGARVRFTRAGYTPVEVTLATVGADVALTPVARTLEATTVTAMRGDPATPVTRTTVTRPELERRYFGQELPVLLQATPSVTGYAEGGSYAGYTHFRVRGIDETRVNITLDGVPLNDPEDQVLYFSNFPDFGNSIESVQVQRGVGTSSNGTAAFAGAVNFESIALASARRGGEVQVTAGAFDTWRASAEGATGLGARGFAAYGRLSALDTDNYRQRAGNRSASGFASAGWFGERSSAKLTAFLGRSRTQLSYYRVDEAALRADPRTNYNTPDDRDDFAQGFVSLTGTRAIGDRGSWSATAYHVAAGGHYDLRFDTSSVTRFGLEHGVTGALTSASLRRGRLALDLGGHANTYARDHWAADASAEDARYYENTGHKRDASGFARGRVEQGPVSLFGELQLRTAWFRYEASEASGIADRDVTWRFANPKVGATWQLARPLSVYASWGRTGREPTRADMLAGYDDVDSSNVAFIGPLSRVRPEYVNDTEIGATWRARTAAVTANVYDMRFRDEIAPIGLLSTFGIPLRKNVDRSYRRGLELDATWSPAAALTLTANAAFNRSRIAEYVDETRADAEGNPIVVTYRDVEPLLTPRVTSAQTATWRALPWLSLTGQGRYVGESFLSNTGDRRFMTPAFWLADLGAILSLRGQELLVQVNNVADERRAYMSGETDLVTSYYYVSAPRNVMVTARVRF